MRFYTAGMFPAAYRNQIIIARHGSWTAAPRSGVILWWVTLKPTHLPVDVALLHRFIQTQLCRRPGRVMVP